MGGQTNVTALLPRVPHCLTESIRSLGLGLLFALFAASVSGATLEEQLQQIVAQNAKLQEQVQAQQKLIDALSAQLQETRKATERHEEELRSLQDRENTPAPTQSMTPQGESAVRISGEAGLGYFRTASGGMFPNGDFRLDDAKLFVEAQVWKNIYAFTELNLFTREVNDEAVHVGELYLDFENVSRLWGADNLLNLRVGRIHLPFGEEYQTRTVMKNPLISHSLSDVWGVDEGLEIYGSANGFQYVVAVQNGGHSLLHDFNPDKAVVARIGYQVQPWLHLSGSAMRTGDLSAKDDALSETWFANAFFRSLGPLATTQKFHAELYELDAVAKWRSGHVAGAVGRADFDDDDTSQNNARKIDYYFLEGVQDVGERAYVAARYSALRAPKGYPLVGFGNFGRYFYSGVLTEQLERLSLGLGYRLAPPLVLKFEYGLEHGRLTTGGKRNKEDFISTEVGLKF